MDRFDDVAIRIHKVNGIGHISSDERAIVIDLIVVDFRDERFVEVVAGRVGVLFSLPTSRLTRHYATENTGHDQRSTAFLAPEMRIR